MSAEVTSGSRLMGRAHLHLATLYYSTPNPFCGLEKNAGRWSRRRRVEESGGLDKCFSFHCVFPFAICGLDGAGAATFDKLSQVLGGFGLALLQRLLSRSAFPLLLSPFQLEMSRTRPGTSCLQSL